MLTIHGHGGHGRVVADAWYLASGEEATFTDDAMGTRPKPGDYYICAIGDNEIRSQVRGSVNVIHPEAVVAHHHTKGFGIYIGARAVVGVGARIHDGVIVNTGAIIEHDCEIGEYSHIAPGAILCGGVKIGRKVLVGAGAVIRPGVIVGDHATIGCGSAVVKDVPPCETWAGVPARPIGYGVLRVHK